VVKKAPPKVIIDLPAQKLANTDSLVSPKLPSHSRSMDFADPPKSNSYLGLASKTQIDIIPVYSESEPSENENVGVEVDSDFNSTDEEEQDDDFDFEEEIWAIKRKVKKIREFELYIEKKLHEKFEKVMQKLQ
jgi:hypothetical protein